MTRPWLAPEPLPPEKRLQEPGGAAVGGGRKRVVADFDGPGALADRNARQRRLVLRIQPALRAGYLRRQRRENGGAQAENEPRGLRNGASGSHDWIVPGSAQADVHLSSNIRQTTRGPGNRRALIRPLAAVAACGKAKVHH
jgi:hypothetical protein